ncbi:hypothetical protein BDW42DRAFT_201117 [Aspergillus taichungensis]|uniref:Bacteriophage T5 Orf172 DNA-binding domain-containing protein n=1 Tax=Aspergillus taichungensis TaxID=482145 RepID=A0A2J5I7W9_9EURO|nr:hypothetical protein BDW42DRAFT_201117 [Aspergillus taichungensis]
MPPNTPEVVSFSRKNLTLTRGRKPRCVVLTRNTLEVYAYEEEYEGKKENGSKKPSKVTYEWRCTQQAQGTINAIDEALKRTDEKIQSERLTNISNRESEPEYLRDIAKLCLCEDHGSVIEAAVTQWEEERQHQSPSTPRTPPDTSKPQRSRSTTPTPSPLPETPKKQTAPQSPSSGFDTATPSSSYGKVLWGNLGFNDTKSGWLYVFSIEALEGYYKLGYTTVGITDAKDRLRSHTNCYGPINVVALIGIDNAARYEQLIFKSLSQCRRSVWCPRIRHHKMHREWLQIDKQSLLEKIYSWQRLSVAGLYSPDGKPNLEFLQSTSPGSPSIVDEVLTEYHHSRLATPQSKSRSANDLSSHFSEMSLKVPLRSPSRTEDDDDGNDDDDAIGQSSPSLRKQKDIKTTASRRHSAQPIVKEELAY